MPAHRVNKVGRMCSTPGCCRPSMPDRRLCLRCKQARAVVSRHRYAVSEKCREGRRLRTKLRPPRARKPKN